MTNHIWQTLPKRPTQFLYYVDARPHAHLLDRQNGQVTFEADVNSLHTRTAPTHPSGMWFNQARRAKAEGQVPASSYSKLCTHMQAVQAPYFPYFSCYGSSYFSYFSYCSYFFHFHASYFSYFSYFFHFCASYFSYFLYFGVSALRTFRTFCTFGISERRSFRFLVFWYFGRP